MQDEIVQQAEERLKEGLAPTDDAEHEWIRQERDRASRQQALLNRAKSQQDPYAALQGDALDSSASFHTVRTTAQLRPNAYVPEDLGENLKSCFSLRCFAGIPKPYGGAAPFKPTTLGSTARHTRKPVVKEILL